MTAQEVAQEAHLHINTVIRYLKEVGKSGNVGYGELHDQTLMSF